MTFHFWTFLFEILNFLVLAYVLHWILYRPLREAIERRQAENDRVRREANAALQEANAAKKQLADKLDQANRDRQELLRQASEQWELEKTRRMADLQAAVESVYQQAEKETAQRREDMLGSLENEVGQLAVGLAERLIQQSSNTSLHKQLIRHLIETIRAVDANEQVRVRRDLESDPVVVETAQPIEAALGEELVGQIRDLVGRPCEVTINVAGDLIGGALLRAGGHVWDATLSAQIAAARDSLGRTNHG